MSRVILKTNKKSLEPCFRCSGTNFGKEKTYQDFRDKVTGQIKEISTGYLLYCKDCVNRSLKTLKYKEKLWKSLDDNLKIIKELEGEDEMIKFRDYFQDEIKNYPRDD